LIQSVSWPALSLLHLSSFLLPRASSIAAQRSRIDGCCCAACPYFLVLFFSCWVPISNVSGHRRFLVESSD
jgi:hypothetical protein